jgi:PAS domain S-box-containing protein
MNQSSFFRKFLASGIEGDIQEPQVRRAVIINVFSYFGLLTMFSFIFVGLSEHRHVYVLTMLVFFLLTLSSVLYLNITKKIKFPGHFIVILMLVLELALLVKLGKGETGLFWFYLFPVLALFIHGRKVGAIYVTVLMIISLVYFELHIPGLNEYDRNTVFRFIFSFSITAGMTLVFEVIRYRTYDALVKTNEQKTYYLTQTQQQKEEIMVQAEKLKLSNSELEKLSVVASETTNAVKIILPSGSLEWVNKGFTKLYGYTYEELNRLDKLNISDLNQGFKINEFIEKCLTHGDHCSFETLGEHKNGTKVWVHTTLTPIYNTDDKVVKIIAIDSDVSQMKEAEAAIKQQSEEIMAQKEALSEQNRRIAMQNDMITGSIRYALKIQSAILPSAKTLDKYFNWSIIYRPKNIVSGDFYWFTSIVSPVDNQLLMFVAVVDCTGHGVPGAFMSLIGSRLLNEIVNERIILEPGDILTRLNLEVRKALRQEESDNNDGMDVSLVRFEKMDDNTVEVVHAGAKRNLLYWDADKNEIKSLNGDRKGIGGFSNRPNYKFEQEKVRLNKQSIFYAYSDGLVDQNNDLRKRFGSKRLIDILIQNKTKSLNDQKLILESSFERFKRDEEQRDDISFLFLKVK